MTKETVKDRNGCFLKGEENLLNVVEDRETDIVAVAGIHIMSIF